LERAKKGDEPLRFLKMFVSLRFLFWRTEKKVFLGKRTEIAKDLSITDGKCF
jgi:hypothetical protein